MDHRNNILLFIYNSFSDPIVQGSVLRYIKRYKEVLGGNSTFSLITFEQPQYGLTEQQKVSAIENLEKLDIVWCPMNYHSGGPLILFKKVYDLIKGFYKAYQIKKNVGINLIYTVGTIAGSMGYVLSKLLRVPLLVHTYEPHSAFMADFGYWSRLSPSFVILQYFEKVIGNRARYIMASTNRVHDELRHRGSKATVFQVPSCVDLKKFVRDEKQRQRVRESMGLSERKILLYLGKFGGIYLEAVAYDCFKTYLELKDNAFNPYILILTSNDHKEVEMNMLRRGISTSDFKVDHVSFDKIQDYISACDVGFTGIPGLPSQAYRSPIKNGEYWACGLPIWIMKGVGEDYLIAEREEVGIVIQGGDETSIQSSAQELKRLLQTTTIALAEKCTAVARKYRDIEQTDDYYLEAFDKL